MKNIQSYDEFLNEEINLKKTLAGAALGAGLLFGSPAIGQTNEKPGTEQGTVDVSKKAYHEYLKKSGTQLPYDKWAAKQVPAPVVDKEMKFQKIDSVPKTKDQIYRDTKLFISNTWKSSKNVIDLDDKEAGIIKLKGVSTVSVTVGLGIQTLTYYFSHIVTFQMKDNKYRIIVDNIDCDLATGTGTGVQPKIPINYYGTIWEMGITKEKYWEVMDKLKLDLQSIVDSYAKFIKKPISSEDNW